MVRLSDRGFSQARSLSYIYEGAANDLDILLAAGINHNLGAVPQTISLQVDQVTNWEQHDPSAYILSTSSVLEDTGTTLASVLGPNTQVKLIATTGAPAVSVGLASETQQGLVSTVAQTFSGAKTFSSAVTVSAVSNQLVLSSGVNQLTLNSGTSAAARTYTVPDVGTTANFVMDAGAQDIGGTKAFTSPIIGSINGNAATATILQTARNINGVSFDGSADITVEPYVERDDSSNANRKITFVDNATAGYKRLNMDDNLTYNPTSNTLTASTFSGSLSGNASTASVATTVTLVADNSSNATRYITFTDAATGNENIRTDTGLTYNPSSNEIVCNSVYALSHLRIRDDGSDHIGTINVKNLSASYTFSVPNVGSSDFVMTAGAQDIGGAKAFTSNISAPGINLGEATLTYYNTGTYTPAFTVSGFTYGPRQARWTRVGNLVSVNIFIAWNARPAVSTQVAITLPFTSVNDGSYRAAASLGYIDGILLASNENLVLSLSGNQSAVSLFTYNQLSGNTGSFHTQWLQASGGELQVTLTYLV